MMNKAIKWGLYLISWATLIYATWDLSVGLYFMAVFGGLGLFVSGAIE